jgi:LmbE family N-acetylglucosaminyl deacetylase
MNLLQSIESGGRIARPVALVLAHPDDETASAGGLLQRLDGPRLIYLTDGAPRDLGDSRREGFSNWRDYARHRKSELGIAIDRLGVDTQPIFYDFADKDSVDHLAAIVRRLTADLRGTSAVVTHAYEHGHPDHDTAALAVALARQRLGSEAPPSFEFAGYHLARKGPVYGRFWRGGGTPLHPTGDEVERTRSALAADASQRETLALFPVEPEFFRRAPDYDFTRPAPPGRSLYELYDWDITAERWRERALGLVE